MLEFLQANAGTLVVGLLIAGAVAAIVVNLVRRSRRHKGICHGCERGCAYDCAARPRADK